MDPLIVGAAAVALAAAAGTGLANWRLGRRTEEELERRRREAATDGARRAGLEVAGELRWRGARAGRTVEVELVPLAETTHRTVLQRFRADVRLAPVAAVARANFRVMVRDLIQPGDIVIGHDDVDRALYIRGSDPVDVRALLGDVDVASFLRQQVYTYINREGQTVFGTRFGGIVVDDSGLQVTGAPPPPSPPDGRDPTKLEQVLAAVDFACAFADVIDAAHARAPRGLGVSADLGATSGGSSSAGVRAL